MKGALLLSDQEDFTIVMFVNEQVDTMYEIDENTRNTQYMMEKKIPVFDVFQGITWYHNYRFL